MSHFLYRNEPDFSPPGTDFAYYLSGARRHRYGDSPELYHIVDGLSVAMHALDVSGFVAGRRQDRGRASYHPPLCSEGCLIAFDTIKVVLFP